VGRKDFASGQKEDGKKENSRRHPSQERSEKRNFIIFFPLSFSTKKVGRKGKWEGARPVQEDLTLREKDYITGFFLSKIAAREGRGPITKRW